MTRESAAFLLLMLASAFSGYAQAATSEGPGLSGAEAESSPLWWTLTDEITPQELRAIHEDIELHKERYREAVKAGRQDPLSKEQMELLDFFIDGTTHPELFQMWLVYSGFAARLEFREDVLRTSLAEFGFQSEVLGEIVQFSSEYRRERKLLQEKVREEFKAVEKLASLSKKSLGQESYRLALKAKDAAMLASATGYSVEEVERLLVIWGQTPAADFTAQSLAVLKTLLEPGEWDRFRLYLLRNQAPMMSAKSFAETEGY